MITRCARCHRRYENALQWTFCPHEFFLTPQQRRQKDLAFTLLGHTVQFCHHDQNAPCYRITSVEWDGMVTLNTLPGSFAPSLFRRVASPPSPRPPPTRAQTRRVRLLGGALLLLALLLGVAGLWWSAYALLWGAATASLVLLMIFVAFAFALREWQRIWRHTHPD